MKKTKFDSDLICLVDTETDGLDCINNSIIQLSVIPLTKSLEIDKSKKPFISLIRPKNIPTNIEYYPINKIKVSDLEKLNTVDFFFNFKDWFDDLNLEDGARIAPLAKNWAFDSSFLKHLLGFNFFDGFFRDRSSRDVQTLIHYINDCHIREKGECFFENTSLVPVAKQLKINTDGAHDAEVDCHLTLQVYKKLFELLKFAQKTPKNIYNSDQDFRDVSSMLKEAKKRNLEGAVIWSAMTVLQNNNVTIAQACNFALDEWLK
jgi:DNA polymerase III epsilon subunit-like protein